MAGKKGRVTHKYTDEQNTFFKQCVLPKSGDKLGLESLVEAFQKKFGFRISTGAMFMKIQSLKNPKPSKTKAKKGTSDAVKILHRRYGNDWTPQMDAWLKNVTLPEKNKIEFSKQVAERFNAEFNLNLGWSAVYSKIRDVQGLKKPGTRKARRGRRAILRWTQEQEQWLKDNCKPADGEGKDEMANRFNKQFGTKRSAGSIYMKYTNIFGLIGHVKKGEKPEEKPVKLDAFAQLANEGEDRFKVFINNVCVWTGPVRPERIVIREISDELVKL